MRKNITNLAISLFLLMGMSNVYAQDKYGAEPEKCKTNLSIFYEYAKVKNYGPAYEPWKWCFQNCPSSNLNVYSYGLRIAENRYEGASDKTADSKLIDDIFAQRIKYFPKNLGKVNSDWATSKEKRGASNTEVFELLDAAFKADPGGMSVKNMAKYFQEVTTRNKDTNVQKIFDTYDDVLEAVNVRIDGLSKQKDLRDANVNGGKTLSKKEANRVKTQFYEKNLMGLGQAEGALDQIISEVATCDRLIPLYNKGLSSHSNDAKWLRRAASRLNAKECTEDAIYPKIVEAYVNADPTPRAFIFYASILEDRGQANKAIEYRNKAVDLETDSYKKARYLLSIAQTMRRKSKSQARTYANRAIKARPSMGAAYLFISNLYASSANSCGTDEFSKRMVYVAAANKARRAKAVDPSLTSRANKYIKSYSANAPSKKTIFTMGLTSGASHRVGCWIGETVKIP